MLQLSLVAASLEDNIYIMEKILSVLQGNLSDHI
ncbi:hypothetical protein S101174_02532 (plasmid) [Levilactobacillus brevis]|nr:hypothetical protein S101174_02532 [Levilactobacillus brevis]